MVTIKRIFNPDNFNLYRLFFNNPGSGTRGFGVEVRDLDKAYILIDHYHGRPHNKSDCLFCKYPMVCLEQQAIEKREYGKILVGNQQVRVKPERMDHLEKGAKIGKSRERKDGS